jgi:hypothetical protein
MATRLGAVLLIAALLGGACAVNHATADEPVTNLFFGEGLKNCHQWSEDRKANGAAAKADVAWALGFLSAKNLDHRFTSSVEASEIADWINQQCVAQPKDTIYAATLTFIGWTLTERIKMFQRSIKLNQSPKSK